MRRHSEARRFVSALALVLGAVALLVGLAPSRAIGASLDPTFGEGGTVITKSGTPLTKPRLTDIYTGNAWVLRTDSKDRLIAAGSSGEKLMVARYLPSGEPDPGFGDGGVARFKSAMGYDDPTKARSDVRGIVIQPDGKLVVVARSVGLWDIRLGATRMEILRLHPNGSVDSSFGDLANRSDDWPGSPGWLESPRLSPRNAVILPGGGFLVSGNGEGGSSLPGSPPRTFGFVAKYRRDGSRDKSFGSAGTGVVTHGPDKRPLFSGFSQVKRLGSGKILVGGYSRNRLFAGRLTKSGRWDRTFGQAKRGFTVTTKRGPRGEPCLCDVVTGMDIDRKNRIVLAGYSFPKLANVHRQHFVSVVRLRPNGLIDRSFGRSGRVDVNVGQHVTVRRVAVHPTGRIFVSAWLGLRENARFAVFAFKGNGSPDRAFFKNGRYVSKVGHTATAEDMLIDSNGRLVVSGGTNLDDDASFVLKAFTIGRQNP